MVHSVCRHVLFESPHEAEGTFPSCLLHPFLVVLIEWHIDRSKSLVVIHDGMGDKTVPMFSAVPDEVQRSTSRSLKIGKTAKADNNNDQGDQADPPGTEILTRRARVGYLVMTSGVEELRKTKRLLEVTTKPGYSMDICLHIVFSSTLCLCIRLDVYLDVITVLYHVFLHVPLGWLRSWVLSHGVALTYVLV